MLDMVRTLADAGQGWGRVIVVSVPTPTAPADWSVTVPGGRVWLPLAIHATFASDVNVASRQLALIADAGVPALTAYQATKPTAVAASTTLLVDWQLLAGYSFTTPPVNAQAVHLPYLPLSAGWRLRSTTANAQVGDQWSAITVVAFEADIQAVEQRDVESLDDVIGSVASDYVSHPYTGIFT